MPAPLMKGKNYKVPECAIVDEFVDNKQIPTLSARNETFLISNGWLSPTATPDGWRHVDRNVRFDKKVKFRGIDETTRFPCRIPDKLNSQATIEFCGFSHSMAEVVWGVYLKHDQRIGIPQLCCDVVDGIYRSWKSERQEDDTARAYFRGLCSPSVRFLVATCTGDAARCNDRGVEIESVSTISEFVKIEWGCQIFKGRIRVMFDWISKGINAQVDEKRALVASLEEAAAQKSRQISIRSSGRGQLRGAKQECRWPRAEDYCSPTSGAWNSV